MEFERRHRFRRTLPGALLAGLLIAGMSGIAPAGHGSDSQGEEAQGTEARETSTEPKADRAVVTPYETRPAPSHRVSLRDDRVYFVKQLEETDNGFVLHTLEGETIEVDRSEVAEIVKFK